MELGLLGKTALVTGAGRGIGRTTAKVLAAEGVSVIAVSRTRSDLESLLAELPHDGQDHAALAIDLMAKDGVQTLLKKIGERSVDIVVHNLGGTLQVTDPFCSIADWRDMYRFNLEIPIEINLDLIPKMVERGWGRAVHVSSVAAMENQGPVTYCAMKAALTAYVRSFAGIVAKDNVMLSAVLPGAIFAEGGYWEDAMINRPEHVRQFLTERQRIGRFGTTEEIANAIVFLASDLSSFSVGSIVPIDGGQGRGFFGQ